jgi:glycosyltransferase involved in cell wall biosynthesis
MYWTRFARRVNQQYLEYVNRRFFERAVSVVTNSPEMAEVARDLGGNNVKITGTPINRDILDNPPPPPRTGLRRILYAGRLAPEKNIEAIIHAARHIPDMEFVLAGDGPLRKQVHAAARKTPNLQCKGWLSRTELKSVIESVDLVVLPSRIESFGTVALETMARRRNVLVSPGCGIVSWPSLAESLFIMEPDESLYDALLRLRRMDISVMQQKAEDGYRAAREWNRWTINRWLSLFGEAAARPGMLCAER